MWRGCGISRNERGRTQSRAGHGRQRRLAQALLEKARAELIPHLPIEVLRGRVRRARDLGLDYRTYASVRASAGQGVVGFLFSGNALRVFLEQRKLPGDRVKKLTGLKRCARIALIGAPLKPADIRMANPDAPMAMCAAPRPFEAWPATRALVLQALASEKSPPDGVLLGGDTMFEREWSEAGRLAGYLGAERCFEPLPA